MQPPAESDPSRLGADAHGNGGAAFDDTSADHAEEAVADLVDDAVPARSYEMLPLIGLGGSAGSLGALREFLGSVRPDSGAAYVVVIHLAADRASSLAELLQSVTAMPVAQVVDSIKLEADNVYVIPPGKTLASANGYLRLAAQHEERGRRFAVDYFFRTLADTHGPQATAIVLSGADGDGAIGIKRIKERGGLTIAQDPDEAEHSGMPRSAIATGMVDWVLPVGQIAERWQRYQTVKERLDLPPEDGPQPAKRRKRDGQQTENALSDVLAFLQTRTGHDFSYYKRATILRRLARRMRINEVVDLPTYLAFMRTNPGEAGALMQDVLISVTNFFRDSEAFAALAAQLPALTDGRDPADPIRVWVPACATGEEAYSIAMLLAEHLRSTHPDLSFQVFATDLDEGALAVGRDGSFPPTIAADVSEERLRRFFAKDHHGYRVKSELREPILFARHDLLRDSPFSRIDIVSCRNLFIYLDREAQARAFDLIHFALKPSGRLFLGVSETAEHSPLFRIVDKRHRIYSPHPGQRLGLPLPIGQSTVARALALQKREEERARSVGGAALAWPPAPITAWRRVPGREQESWRELQLRLLERLAPPSVLVTDHYDIVHLSEHAGRFLVVAAGDPSLNLLGAIHPSLSTEMRTALLRAEGADGVMESAPVALELGGDRVVVTLRVSQLHDHHATFYLVVFESRAADSALDAADALRHPPPGPPVARDRALEQEVESLKWHLRDATERRDLAIEELRAGNEELQAINEELRSSTEELETSREELQSINEELTTVNAEMKAKVDELSRSHSDMFNLIAATTVAAIFLTRELKVMRFTPSAVSMFNLIASDVGRPLADLATDLAYPELADDAHAVLADLVPHEREVTMGERWFLSRILPYRTEEDRIAGIVLTFIDITSRRLAEDALRVSEERYRTIISQASTGVCHMDLDGVITIANLRFAETVGSTPDDLVGREMLDITHPDDRAGADAAFKGLIASGQPYELEKRYLRPGGGVIWIHNSVSLLRDSAGVAQAVTAIVHEITERKEAEIAVRRSSELMRLSEARLRAVFDNAVEYAIVSMDLERRVTDWNIGAERATGFEKSEMIGALADIFFTDEDRAQGAPAQEAGQALAEGRAADERWHLRKDGTRFWGSGVMMPIVDDAGVAAGLLKIFRDTSVARETQLALENNRAQLLEAFAETVAAREELEAAARAKDRFLAMLSHELRTPLTPVVMAAHALERTADLPDSVRATLAVIRRNVRAEMVLIDDLLDLTRINSGKLELTLETLDLHDAVRGAIEVCEVEMRARQQRLELHLDAERFCAEGDFHRLRQVFWNLLRNASKFTPVGGTVTLRTAAVGDNFILAVQDNGIGIQAETLRTIFDAFEQGGEKITREFGGLGLGLAIAKAMVDAHHGTLHATSEGVGRGATFTVALPLSR